MNSTNTLSPAKKSPLTPQGQELANGNLRPGFRKETIQAKNDWATRILDNGFEKFERGRKS